MVELAMQLWARYPWNLYADIAGVDIEKAPLLAFDVNMVAVDQAVALLNPREQSIIQLRYKQVLTFREAAEQLPHKWDKTRTVTGNRVQQLLGRAHRRLRVSPLAGSFLFSGTADGQEDEIDRREMQLEVEKRIIDTLNDILTQASAFADTPDPLREYLQGVDNLGEKSIAEVIEKFVELGIYTTP